MKSRRDKPAKKSPKPAPVAYYKVLAADGTSKDGGKFEWSLPSEAGPGAWHELAAEEPLVLCASGFHLTTNPRRWWAFGAHVFAAEFTGEVYGEPNDEKIVCRRVRLLRRIVGPELSKLLTPEARGPLAKPAKRDARSAARLLVQHVWDNVQKRESWRTLNAALFDAVLLAVSARLAFDRDDVRGIVGDMRGGYWFSGDAFYAAAIKAGHESACKSYEAHARLKPMTWDGRRLHVGAHFVWNREGVTVTSLGDGKLVACSYKDEADGEYGHKLKRRYTLTRSEIAAAQSPRKEKAAS